MRGLRRWYQRLRWVLHTHRPDGSMPRSGKRAVENVSARYRLCNRLQFRVYAAQTRCEIQRREGNSPKMGS